MLKKILVFFIWISLIHANQMKGQRIMEPLGRGTIAIRQNTASVFVNWRIFSSEVNNDVTYNLYRNGEQIASDLKVSNYTDATSTNGNYQVAAVVSGVEKAKSPEVEVQSDQVLEFKINRRSQHYVHFAYPGDLDGDGEMDLVVNRIPLAAGVNCYVEGYKLDGTHLWTVDMGPNSQDMNNIVGGSASINNGQHDGMAVYDLDGDGIAEVMLQSANGTKFNDGTTISYNDNRQNFVSIVDGATGVEKARTALPTDYINIGILQTQFSIGYLDGIHPSVVVKGKTRASNGWFHSLVATYDYDGNNVTIRWKNTNIPGPEFHQYRMADVDQDGKDEVCDGGYVLDDDGSLLYSMAASGAVHGDRFHIGDFDPDRNGLEGYAIQQDNASGLAWYYYDAKDGTILQSQYLSYVADYARGNAADLDPNHAGYEMWTFTDGIYNAQDGKITNNITSSYPNFRLWWDGDEQSEMLDGVKFLNWNYNSDNEERLLTASQWGAMDVWRAAPIFYGDIVGDWREEVAYEKNDHSSILIFTSKTSTDKRIYTLMQNPEYRLCLTTRGYYQSAQLDYYLGYDMPTPPTPAIQHNELIWQGNTSNLWNTTDNNWQKSQLETSFTAGDTVLFGIAGNVNNRISISETVNSGLTKVLSAVDYVFEGDGELSGESGLIKAGVSNLTLDVNASYTGETRVEQGTLVINKNLTESEIHVFGGGTLAGNGIISKVTNFEKRAVIAPGNADEAGTLTFTSSLNIPQGVICAFDLTDDSTGLVKPNDRIITDENIVLAEGAIFRFNALNEEIKPGIYPLISYSAELSGELSNIIVEGLFGKKYTLVDTLNAISLQIIGTRNPSSITWKGSENIWDLQQTRNWSLENSNVEFVAGDSVVFSDEGAAQANVQITGELPVGRMQVTGNTDYTFGGSGVIGGNGDLIKEGAGKLTMQTSQNTYAGKTIIQGGELEITKVANAGEPSSLGANPSENPEQIELNNAILTYQNNSEGYTNRGMLLNGEKVTINIPTTGSNLSLAGTLRGTATLEKTGNGTLYLINNNNPYSGGTIINQGTIQLNDPGNGMDVASLGSGNITFKGGILRMGNTSGYTDFNTNIEVPEDMTGVLFADMRCNYGGRLSGKGTLTVVLPGSIDRTIWRGDWSQFEGTVKAFGTGPMRLSSSAGYAKMTFDLGTDMSMYFSTGTTGGDNSAQTVRVGGISGSKNSYLDGENWYIGGNNQDITFKGVIRGNSLTKEGNGALVLTNANTYNGGTRVNAGTLIVRNTSGSGTGTGIVTVNNGGTLDGTGTIQGRVNVNMGGTLAIGETLKTFTIQGATTLVSGSTMKLDVYGNTGVSDVLNTGSNSLKLSGTLAVNNLSTSDYAAGLSYKIFNGTNISGAFESIEPVTPGDGLMWDASTLTEDGTLRIKLATSVKDAMAGNCRIYPNPANNVLRIELKNKETIQLITLRDMAGRTLGQWKISGDNTLDISNLPTGPFLIEVRTTGKVYTQKIVKL